MEAVKEKTGAKPKTPHQPVDFENHHRTDSAYNPDEHYRIEKQLAQKLMSASKEERRSLYTEVYDEMFSRVPMHPMLVSKDNPTRRQKEINTQTTLIRDALDTDSIFLEIGPGDCAFSFAVAQKVHKVYAIDVSRILSDNSRTPDNFELVISDGSSVPTPAESVDVAYSNQLMEHLHPDDALTQLQNIYATLKPGGQYFCQTPNRLSGPHDQSRGYDQVARCFHLREYTATELATLFRQTGFRKVRCTIGAKGLFLNIPVTPISLLEKLLSLLPYSLSNPLACSKLLTSVLDIRMIGYK